MLGRVDCKKDALRESLPLQVAFDVASPYERADNSILLDNESAKTSNE